MRRAFRTLPCAAAVAALATAAPAVAAPYFDVAKLPAPPVTGKEVADAIAAYSTTYANRVSGTPQAAAAAQELVDQSEALGYDAGIVDVAAEEGAPAAGTHAVVASRKGTTKPDEHILFVAHYDIVPETINGAYDDGSGTMMLLALAKALRNVPTNRTVDFVWYNTEEQGLLASQGHAREWSDAGSKVRAVLGFDMVGIAWPVGDKTGNSCLCMFRGDEDDAFDDLLRHVNYGVLGFPGGRNEVEVRGINVRNSDESSWDRVGYPTLRWSGMRTAASYPAYHRYDDTMETIDEVAGGRTFFEQGLRNTLLSSYYTVLVLDNDQPVARVSSEGTGRVTFDASGSSDADGPVSGIHWDFGDGTSASGARVTHEYTRPGDYTATVAVGDSLWPQVRSTASVPVHVPAPPLAQQPPPQVAPSPAGPAVKKAKKRKGRCASARAKVRKAKGRKAKRRAARTLKRCLRAKRRAQRPRPR